MADNPGFPDIDIGDLMEAMRTGDLTLAYQPMIAMATNGMSSVEALARWHHPELGSISPAHFIAVVEASELIDSFTIWVIETAAADWRNWRRRGLMTNVSVNVSAKNLGGIDFPDIVAGICRKQDMPCHCLTIELTESAAQDLIPLLDTLGRFRIKGMAVSLDDFGTGYATLRRLHRLPFSEIKIDRSFVTHADTSSENRAFVRSTIDLAHDLGLRIVAEGVETAAVKEMLAEMGCDVAQGFYFAKPMPAADLPQWTMAGLDGLS